MKKMPIIFFLALMRSLALSSVAQCPLKPDPYAGRVNPYQDHIICARIIDYSFIKAGGGSLEMNAMEQYLPGFILLYQSVHNESNSLL